jgi:hypothetical protein
MTVPALRIMRANITTKIRTPMQESPYRTLAFLALFGAAIGLGQLLKSKEPVTARAAVGRALITGGLATGGGLIQLWFPNAPFLAILGAGAFLASLGTDVIVSILRKYVVKK